MAAAAEPGRREERLSHSRSCPDLSSSTTDDLQPLRRCRSVDFLPPDMSESGAEDGGSRPPGLNLVLCGRRGAGKTSAAQALLGQTDLHPGSGSSECVKHQGEVCGRWLSVVEMPPLSGKPQEEVMEESFRCLSLCDPEGVHAFILVLPVGPLTDEDKGELQTIQDAFSSRVNDFTIVLFTVDPDPSAPADAGFLEKNKEIQELCESCGGRSVVLNLKDSQQIPELLEMVETMSSKVSRSFSNSMLSMAYTEKMSKVQAELQDVKQKSETEGERLKTELKEMKNEKEDLKKKHREDLKTLRAQVDEERKQRVHQLKERDRSMEKEREERKKEQDEEQKRHKKQEEAQRREWKQKLDAAERTCQSEREQREKAEKKLEQVEREKKRDRDAWIKEKEQIWERINQDLKQSLEEVKKNLEEEKRSHRKLQEEFNWKRRKWTYPWFFLSALVLLSVYLFVTQRLL